MRVAPSAVPARRVTAAIEPVASGRLAKDEFKVARRGWHFQHYLTAPRKPQTARETVSHIVEGGCSQPRPTIQCLAGTRDDSDPSAFRGGERTQPPARLLLPGAVGWFVDRPSQLDLSAIGEKRQPYLVLHVGVVACESPTDDGPLRPRGATQ